MITHVENKTMYGFRIKDISLVTSEEDFRSIPENIRIMFRNRRKDLIYSKTFEYTKIRINSHEEACKIHYLLILLGYTNSNGIVDGQNTGFPQESLYIHTVYTGFINREDNFRYFNSSTLPEITLDDIIVEFNKKFPKDLQNKPQLEL